MTANNPRPLATEGTVESTTYYDGPADVHDDVRMQFRYYTCMAGAERMVGKIISITFTLDRPVKDVWPYFKDSNLWHNTGGYYYSGVLGDLEGKTFRLSLTPNEPGPHQYKVIKVFPEHLIVWEQPGPWEGGPQPYDGYGVYMLNEHDGTTFVTILMQHAMRPQERTDAELFAEWRNSAPQGFRRWRDFFIPTLKRLLAQDK